MKTYYLDSFKNANYFKLINPHMVTPSNNWRKLLCKKKKYCILNQMSGAQLWVFIVMPFNWRYKINLEKILLNLQTLHKI